MTGGAADEARQQLLEALLAGERTMADPEVQSAMRADDRFAREVMGLQQLQATLSRRVADVQQDLAFRAPELEAAVEASVLAHGRVPLRSGWRWLPWLLAAAVLVGAFLAWPRTEGPRSPQYLGLLRVEPTADGRGLQFLLSLPTQGSFVVRVLDVDGKPVLPGIEVETSSWVPDAAIVARWPAGGSVDVEAFQADGQSLASARLRWSPPR